MTRARADDLAFFVVGVGMSPADYWRLTWAERNAIVRAYKQAHRH